MGGYVTENDNRTFIQAIQKLEEKMLAKAQSTFCCCYSIDDLSSLPGLFVRYYAASLGRDNLSFFHATRAID